MQQTNVLPPTPVSMLAFANHHKVITDAEAHRAFHILIQALRAGQVLILDFAGVGYVYSDFWIHFLGALYWEFDADFLKAHIQQRNTTGLITINLRQMLDGCRQEIEWLKAITADGDDSPTGAHAKLSPFAWGAWRQGGNPVLRVLKFE